MTEAITPTIPSEKRKKYWGHSGSFSDLEPSSKVTSVASEMVLVQAQDLAEGFIERPELQAARHLATNQTLFKIYTIV